MVIHDEETYSMSITPKERVSLSTLDGGMLVLMLRPSLKLHFRPKKILLL